MNVKRWIILIITVSFILYCFFSGKSNLQNGVTNNYSYPYRAENGDIRGSDNDNDGRKEPVYVRGYYKKDGSYVRGHYRALPQR